MNDMPCECADGGETVDNRSIAETLASFNRKERYWLVRNCLGDEPPPLCQCFRERLAKVLGPRLDGDLSEAAWWATDYHLDWLIAALHSYAAPSEDGTFECRANVGDEIKGTQEDIDLLIACERDVILVEVKAFGAWGRKQLESKIERLSKLCDATGTTFSNAGPDHQVRMHFVLMSRRPPAKVIYEKWPCWAVKSRTEPYWLELQIDSALTEIATVVRCGEDGDRDANGGYWTIERRHLSAAQDDAVG
jgi:hypothetical protein